MSSLVLAASASQIIGERSMQNDAYYVSEEAVLVSDGVGDHADGHTAAESLTFALHELRESGTALTSSLVYETAHERLKHDRSSGAATMAIAVLTVDGRLDCACVGDSRVFVLRQGNLLWESPIENRAGELASRGLPVAIGDEHRLLRSINALEVFVPSGVEVPALEGDVVMICSDGVTSVMTDTELRDLVLTAPRACSAVETILNVVVERGATDNATMCIAEVEAR